MRAFLIVFLGAGLGGALRHGVNGLALRLVGAVFPWGTLTVNVVGSLVMGLAVGWFALRADPSPGSRLFLTTGLLGGFTTFSAFSLDFALLVERGQAGAALAYAALSVALSLLAVFVGLQLVRTFG